MSQVTTNNYVQLAMRTNSDTVGTVHMHPDLIHAALGMGDEILELSEAIRNNDQANIGEELGDLCWFLALSGNDIAEQYPLFVRTSILASKTPYEDLQVAVNTYISRVKKNYAYGKQYKAADRLTDIQNIWTALCDTASLLKLDIMKILSTNLEKLQHRFPEKFTAEAANNRDLSGEREILENAVSGKSTYDQWLAALPEIVRDSAYARGERLIICVQNLAGRRIYDSIKAHRISDHAYHYAHGRQELILRADTVTGQLRDQITAIIKNA